MEQYHWDIIRRVQPELVLVCEPYFSDVSRLRSTVPDIVIVGRMYGDHALGISNWSMPDARAVSNMVEFGRRSGQKANQSDIDIMVPFNEPSIDWNLPTTPEGFSFLAHVFDLWLTGFRETTDRKAGTIPLAPGNREDDYGTWGYRGADILKPVYQKADVLVLHNYWNEGVDSDGIPLVRSPWEGNRASLQIPAYEWAGRPWTITEFNRPLKREDQKPSIAEESRTFIAQHMLKPAFLGAAWFLLDGNDNQFKELRMVDNPWLIDTAINVNAADLEGVGMDYKEIKVTITPGLAVYGKTWRAVVDATMDGQPSADGVLTCQFQLPRNPDGDVLWTQEMIDGKYTYKLDAQGRAVVSFDIPADAGPPDGSEASIGLLASVVDFAGQASGAVEAGFGNAQTSVPIHTTPPAKPPEGPSPEQPGPTPEPTPPVSGSLPEVGTGLHRIFAAAGMASQHADKIKELMVVIHEEINHMKEAAPVNPRKP